MMLFWGIAAAMVLVAVGLIALPILRRRAAPGPSADAVNLTLYRSRVAELKRDLEADVISPDQFEQANAELERQLLGDVQEEPDRVTQRESQGGRWVASLVVLAIPLIAVSLYRMLGDERAFSPPRQLAQTSSQAPADPHEGAGAPEGGAQLGSVDEMTERLAARLADNPNDANGWVLLARSYEALGRYGEANLAYARAHELVGDQPDLLAQYAESLAMGNGNRMAGRPMELIKTTLSIDPKHRHGLWLAGVAAFQQRDYQGAADYWEQLSAQLDPGEQQQTVQKFIAQARAELSAGGAPPTDTGAGTASTKTGSSAEAPVGSTAAPAASSTAAPAASEPASETGAGFVARVSISPELASQIDPSDTLFVFARAAEGPPMPLAIARLKAGDLPTEVRLDDSMAMMPAMRMSNFPEVVLGARISKSGNATASSGDLEGSVGPLATSQGGTVEVQIDRVVP